MWSRRIYLFTFHSALVHTKQDELKSVQWTYTETKISWMFIEIFVSIAVKTDEDF